MPALVPLSLTLLHPPSWNPQPWAHCHPIVHLSQQTALPYSPLLPLGEYNRLSAFLLLRFLCVTKKDTVKINCLGQGHSIDSANSVDAPSESEGERDKSDWHFRGRLWHFCDLCLRNGSQESSLLSNVVAFWGCHFITNSYYPAFPLCYHTHPYAHARVHTYTWEHTQKQDWDLAKGWQL